MSNIPGDFEGPKLYIIELTISKVKKLFKIGITKDKLARRFDSCRKMPFRWKVIYIRKCKSKKHAEKLEQRLKYLNQWYQEEPPVPFYGKTECFSSLMLTYQIISVIASNMPLPSELFVSNR